MENKCLLYAKGIDKQFPGVHALDNVSFDLNEGEVHVLIGENGAGKSTLMKIIAGVYQPDKGEIFLKGKKVEFNAPLAAQAAGISTIYQEFNLIPHMNVAQNIFLARYPKRFGFLLDHKQMHKDAEEILKSLSMDIDTHANCVDLGTGQQQMVEVAKALSMKSKILIMDEPTASLTDPEIDRLFETINRLTASGIGIIYISHRLEEVKKIGDRVTVMRDGKYIGTIKKEEIEIPELVKMMVGRDIESMYAYSNSKQEFGEEALRVENIVNGRQVRGVSLNVRSGEIVGLAGLVGAGRTDLVRAIFGVDKFESGKVFVFGEEVKPTSPRHMVDKGLCLIPEDRKGQGLCMILPVAENVVLPNLKQIFGGWFVKLSKQKNVVDKYIKELRIATPSQSRVARFLSGGTQQKVVLAKWLCTNSRIFIFDEPTRGIDVGAKVEIHALMRRLVKDGAAILMVSSELPEVLGMSDRVYVMREGSIVAELDCEEATQEKVIALAMGGA